MTLDIDIEVRQGRLDLAVRLSVGNEVVAILGPNGAGKSTLLRAVAGLVPLAAGVVRLDDRVLADPGAGVRVPPAARGIGLVFQDYLLFAHLSVADNVAFGLRSQGMSRREASRQARVWLERVGLAEHADVRPGQLSGGQAQRVALARALAAAPAALLLDEPLAALDVEARHDIRRQLRSHLAAFDGPCLLVTHDPLEAATLADRLVVLEAGRLTHAGSLADITRRPRSAWVARLAGVNLYQGLAGEHGLVRLDGGGELVAAGAPAGRVFATLPPAAVALYRRRPHGTPRNVWPVTVTALDRYGDRVRVQLDGPVALVAEVTPAATAELDLAAGGQLWAAVKATEVSAYPA